MKNKYILTLLCALTFSLSGCLSSILEPSEDPTAFYILKDKKAETKSEIKLDMNISPISLPAYMDKAQIVSHSADNMIVVSEFNRWAESLSNAVVRVFYMDLVANLSAESKVYAYPISAFDKTLPTLTVSILDLAGDINGESSIKALWSLGESSTDKLLAEGIFEKTIANGKNYANYVNSLSELLFDLSANIAEEISKELK